MTNLDRCRGCAPVALVLFMAAAAAAADAAPQSTATGFDAQLTSGGVATELGPIAGLSGEASGRYDSLITVAKFSESAVVAAVPLSPTLFATGRGLTSHVSSSGIEVDSRGSQGENALANASIILNINPPPPLAGVPTPAPALSITAREVVSSANYSIVYGGLASANGAASFGALKITGTLLGKTSLSHSGPTVPNTVIYDSPTVTITLNRQIKTGLISCDLACAFTVTGIDVAAIDVELHNAVVGGRKISGHILVDDAHAQ